MNPDKTAPQLHAEAITDGIDISTWTIKRNNVNLQYSGWDFAGQTIYYNTHQVGIFASEVISEISIVCFNNILGPSCD